MSEKEQAQEHFKDHKPKVSGKFLLTEQPTGEAQEWTIEEVIGPITGKKWEGILSIKAGDKTLGSMNHLEAKAVVAAHNAALAAERERYRKFIQRCADHMISGSNIADTPLPTEDEWREILDEKK
jgi:hypothetical protein